LPVKKRVCIYFAAIAIATAFSGNARAERWRMILDLEGRWKFTIGDNRKWASPNYPDNDWESIDVPSTWEDEGFNGYNGYAWYRTSFDGADLKSKGGMPFNLFMGYIDDVDEVFLNGHKIGASGSFPPHYHTAYNAMRNYSIPNEYLNLQGKNVIAVRVYDSEVKGGIVSGDVGIFTNDDDNGLAVNLRGLWDFTLADRKFPSGPRVDYSEKHTPPEKAVWAKISVPGQWEHQGYPNHDGSAWYRKQFVVPKELKGEDLVLMLGKIDDFDQTYLNGKLVGSTNQHDKFRIYYISSEAVNAGAMNLLLVFVDDPQGAGGIWEGPIGIMKQTEFTRYLRWRQR